MKEFLVIRMFDAVKFEDAMQEAFSAGWSAVFYSYDNEPHPAEAPESHYIPNT